MTDFNLEASPLDHIALQSWSDALGNWLEVVDFMVSGCNARIRVHGRMSNVENRRVDVANLPLQVPEQWRNALWILAGASS